MKKGGDGVSKIEVPIWHKEVLTPEECSSLTGINVKIIRAFGQLANMGKGNFPCFWTGNHMKISRKLLINWLDEMAQGHYDLQNKLAERLVANAEKQKIGRPRKVRSA